MNDLLIKIPPEYLVIIILFLAGVVILGIKLFIKNIDALFNKISTKFDEVNLRFNTTDKKIDLLSIEQESTDFALDKCLVPNGKRYGEHKLAKKNELINDYDYVNKP